MASDLIFGAQLPPLGPLTLDRSGREVGGLPAKEWDLAIIGGQTLPGHSKIVSGSIALKIDRKKKAGSSGANPTFHGLDPQPLELEVTTYNDADRDSLAAVVGSFIPTAAKEMKSYSFDHPAVWHLGLSNVIVQKVGAFIIVSPGVTKMHIGLLHWILPSGPSVTKTPKTAIGKVPDNRTGANKKPTEQPGFGGPPPGLKPDR